MTELIDKVREALIALAYQESVELYHDPEFKEMIMPLLLEPAKKLARKTVEEDDDLDDSDLDKLIQFTREELEKNIFGSEDQIRDMAFQSAKNNYTTKQELEDNLERKIAENFRDIELDKEGEAVIEKIRDLFKECVNNLKESFDFTDKLLSTLTEYAKEEGIEKTITIERRNAAIRAIIPSKEEYIAKTLKNINAINVFLKKAEAFVKELEDDDDKSDDDKEVDKILASMAGEEGIEDDLDELEIMSSVISSIGEDMLKYSASKIYGE